MLLVGSLKHTTAYSESVWARQWEAQAAPKPNRLPHQQTSPLNTPKIVLTLITLVAYELPPIVFYPLDQNTPCASFKKVSDSRDTGVPLTVAAR